MNKVKNRTFLALLLVLALCTGLCIYFVQYIRDGASWVSFSSNRSVYISGILTRGRLVDRNGNELLQNTKDGRIYHTNNLIRTATVHLTGDRSGNIGTSIPKKYASLLSGFDLINGVYSLTTRGETLKLTVDAHLCADAYAALNGKSGCVLVYNYETGDVLCSVSSPAFDPDDPPADLETNPKYAGAYVNRALSSVYPPGSTFKLITTACAIDTLPDLFEREFTCEGSYVIDGQEVHCQGVHGKIRIGDALARSCNCAFAQLSVLLGSERLSKYAEKFGLTESLSVGEFACAAGNFDEAADDYTLAWSGIGQSTDLVNPMSMLRAMGAVANHGTAVSPHLLYGEHASRRRVLSEKTAETLKSMMAYNVHANYGDANYPGLALCAKSGTAEIGGGAPHAWFVGFLDDESAPLAFVVLIENGGSGSQNAGTVANTVLQSAVKRLK